LIIEIEIAGEATYPAGGERLTDLKRVNYLFGHNGCGKTTISRAIHDSSICAGYTVSWRDGRELATLVFNRDFADASFGDQMQGIFTLGEDSTRAAAEIERLTRGVLEVAGRTQGRVHGRLHRLPWQEGRLLHKAAGRGRRQHF